MINYFAARKLRHAKRHFDVMRREVHASGRTILYFIRTHLQFLLFSMFYLYQYVGSSDIPQAC